MEEGEEGQSLNVGHLTPLFRRWWCDNNKAREKGGKRGGEALGGEGGALVELGERVNEPIKIPKVGWICAAI